MSTIFNNSNINLYPYSNCLISNSSELVLEKQKIMGKTKQRKSHMHITNTYNLINGILKTK